MKKNFQQLMSSAIKAHEKKNYQSELLYLNKLISKNPNNLELIKYRANCHWNLENFPSALIDYARVVENNPNDQESMVNFGVALQRCNRYEHAREILEYAIEVNPNNAAAYINLCQVYSVLNLPQEELKVAVRAVKADPKNPLAYNNLGTILLNTGFRADGKEAFLTAKAIDPNFILARLNLAQLDLDAGNVTQAILELRSLLELDSITNSYKDYVNFILANAYLKSGQLDLGWPLYEYGFNLVVAPQSSRSIGKFPEPKWQGQELKGCSLLVLREQGVGDELLYSSCFIDLEELNAKVTVQCDSRLLSIFQRTYKNINFISAAQNENIYELCKEFDYISAIGSLPGYFRKKLEDFDRHNKYLQPLPELVSEYKNRLRLHKNKKLIHLILISNVLKRGLKIV